MKRGNRGRSRCLVELESHECTCRQSVLRAAGAESGPSLAEESSV